MTRLHHAVLGPEQGRAARQGALGRHATSRRGRDNTDTPARGGRRREDGKRDVSRAEEGPDREGREETGGCDVVVSGRGTPKRLVLDPGCSCATRRMPSWLINNRRRGIKGSQKGVRQRQRAAKPRPRARRRLGERASQAANGLGAATYIHERPLARSRVVWETACWLCGHARVTCDLPYRGSIIGDHASLAVVAPSRAQESAPLHYVRADTLAVLVLRAAGHRQSAWLFSCARGRRRR